MAHSKTEYADIVITVLGGCVNGVFTDIPHARITLIDWDNLSDSDSQLLCGGSDADWPHEMSMMPGEARLAYENFVRSIGVDKEP